MRQGSVSPSWAWSIAVASGLVGCGAGESSPVDALEQAGQPLGAALYPDIQEEIPAHLQIVNQQSHELLRFSTTHMNLGAGTLQIRGGGQIAPCDIDGVHYDSCTYATQEILDATGQVVATHPAGVAFYHPQHNHWHQSAVARFELRSGTLAGPQVVTGTKITFCLIDFDKTDWIHANSVRMYNRCDADVQGISVGWGDSYHMSTEGQDFDVTGIPAGTYYLTHLADPENHWLETVEDNNFAWVKFVLTRKGANPEITVVDHSPCEVGTTCGTPSNK